MNNLFSKMCEIYTPKLNKEVVDGLAFYRMKDAEFYIDTVFHSASKSFPPGLVYEGYERCTPQEEFEEVTKIKTNKRIFDLAKSDIYSLKYYFSFEGVKLPPRFIHLPFVREGGLFSLGGALYQVTPVLSDKVISPGYDSVFVRLLRDKINFKRCYHAVVINNIRETSHVIWSKIHRKPRDTKKVPITTKAATSLSHYLFVKYGFTKTFEKYCGFVPIVGTDDILDSTYPPDKWMIVESSKVKPKTYIGEFYEPTTIKLVIPIDKWTPLVKGLVVGFFYVVDHFPNRFKPGYLDSTNLWAILLGHIVFSGLYGENKLYDNMMEHFSSLDDYVDSIVLEKLKETTNGIEDFYDLLAYILGNFNNMVLNSENTISSMYGKSLEILYYMLYEVTYGIFNVNFKLSKLANKKQLIVKDVIEAFNKNIKPGAIFSLTSGKIITEPVTYCGDHKFPKVTSKITEQESLPGGTRGSTKRLKVGEDKFVDVSMIEAGSVLYLSKSNPTPTNHINPFVCLNPYTGVIMPNPKFVDLLNKTSNLFSNRTVKND